MNKYRLTTQKSSSIRKKLIAIFLVLIISICAVSVFVANTISKATIKNQTYAYLETIAQSRANHIETYFEGNVELIKIAATNTEHSIEELIEIMNLSADFDEIFTLDSSGKVFATTNPEEAGENYSNQTFFTEGKIAPYIGIVGYDEEFDTHGIVISTPNAGGVFAVRLNLEKLEGIVKDRIGLGETGEVLISVQGENERIYLFERLFESEALPLDTNEATAEPMKQALLGNEILFENALDYRGEPVIAVSRYVELGKIGLVTKIDIKETLAPVIIMQNTMIIIITIIAIISLIIANLFAQSISEPIVKLRNAIRIFSKGNYDSKLDIKSNDEIGELAQAFNEMTGELKVHRTGLEDTIARRTRELNSKVDDLEQYKKATVDRELKMVELKEKIKLLEQKAGVS